MHMGELVCWTLYLAPQADSAGLALLHGQQEVQVHLAGIRHRSSYARNAPLSKPSSIRTLTPDAQAVCMHAGATCNCRKSMHGVCTAVHASGAAAMQERSGHRSCSGMLWPDTRGPGRQDHMATVAPKAASFLPAFLVTTDLQLSHAHTRINHTAPIACTRTCAFGSQQLQPLL